MILRVCTCGTHIPATSRRCPHCVTQDNTRRATNAKAHGLTTSRWKRDLRRRILDRDQHLCQLRRPGCTIHATTVHLNPRLNGQHQHATEGDCISACRHCHGVADAPRAAIT